LAPPKAVTKTPTYTGPQWPDFDPSAIVVVQPATVVISIFVVIDIATGDTFDQPPGTDGTEDTGDVGQGGSTSTSEPAAIAEPVLLFDNGNIGGVSPGATAPSIELSTPTRITKIVTYHYIYPGGLPAAGLIGMLGEDGEMYGPYNAAGTPGQGDIANAYWSIEPEDMVLPAGRYTLFDSDLSTFSQNAESGGVGMTQIWGIPLQ
jgi:hypothetical protein